MLGEKIWDIYTGSKGDAADFLNTLVDLLDEIEGLFTDAQMSRFIEELEKKVNDSV